MSIIIEKYVVGKVSKYDKCTILLLKAILSKNVKAIKYLTDRNIGIDINKDNIGVDTLIRNIDMNNIEIIKLLIKAEVKLININHTPLIQAIKNRNIEIAKLLIEYGADVNEIDYYNAYDSHCNVDYIYRYEHSMFTPLLAAIAIGSLELIELLINKGADANIKVGIYSPLIYAVIYNFDIKIFELLITLGANIDSISHIDLTGNIHNMLKHQLVDLCNDGIMVLYYDKYLITNPCILTNTAVFLLTIVIFNKTLNNVEEYTNCKLSCNITEHILSYKIIKLIIYNSSNISFITDFINKLIGHKNIINMLGHYYINNMLEYIQESINNCLTLKHMARVIVKKNKYKYKHKHKMYAGDVPTELIKYVEDLYE